MTDLTVKDVEDMLQSDSTLPELFMERSVLIDRHAKELAEIDKRIGGEMGGGFVTSWQSHNSVK